MRVPRTSAPGRVEWHDEPEPQIAPGEVLLQPLACGICTTDVRAVRNGSDASKGYGLGHEVVGRIVAVGDGTERTIGQRVVAAPYVPCGDCYLCRRGQPTLCENLFDHGLDPGGLAERIRLSKPLVERGTFSVPDALPSEVAALTEPVACCVQAVEACRVTQRDSVLVVGDGPMGLINAAVARAYGASRVIVAGLTPARLEVAAAHYADVVINVAEEDLPGRVLSLTENRGADAVLVAVSSPDALVSGLGAVRRGGVVNAFAGVPEGSHVSLDMRRLHYDQLSITGSFGVAPEHLKKALALLSAGKVDIRPLITATFSFEETSAAIEYAARQMGMKAVVLFE
jgi:L-iditol 2-dehydrogenase